MALKKKKKLKSIARLVDDAAVILQRIVRMKAADSSGYLNCVTCGAVKHWQEVDGGHFISRTYTAHKLLEENIHAQCKHCNGFKGGAGPEYTIYMIDTYGRDFVDHILATKAETRKYNRVEITGIIEDLKHYEKRVATNSGLA